MPKPSKKVVTPKKAKAPLWLWAIIGVGVALIALVLVQTASNTASPAAQPLVTGGPALQVDQEKLDFGDVKLGRTVEAKFVVTNVGDQPLQFKQKPYVEVVEGC